MLTQVLSKADAPLQFEDPSTPFSSGTPDEVPAPVGYKYRVFTLGKVCRFRLSTSTM